ncbi:MAG: transposase family protein, partial [Pyrinomonadaceae bacterium]|nr:transposase family protein [Pyrinomonadaceae bacterium]
VLSSEKFKRKLGVKRATFEAMLKVLQERERGKKKQGRRPALSLEDQLVLSLSFWREYRSHFHLAEDWGVDESTIRRTIERVEDALIRSGQFSLPGRKTLREDATLEVVVADIAESPIERPQKNSAAITQARKILGGKSATTEGREYITTGASPTAALMHLNGLSWRNEHALSRRGSRLGRRTRSTSWSNRSSLCTC